MTVRCEICGHYHCGEFGTATVYRAWKDDEVELLCCSVCGQYITELGKNGEIVFIEVDEFMERAE